MSVELQQRFLPSLQTAQLAVRSLERGAPRLDVTTTKLPWPTISYGPSIHFTLRPRCFPDYELVRENLGETAEAQLGVLANYYTPDTGSRNLLVLTPGKRFTQDLSDCIVDNLGIDYKQPTYSSFMNAYAQEFYDWLSKSHSERSLIDRRHYPITISPDGGIYIHCEKEPIDIPPLEE